MVMCVYIQITCVRVACGSKREAAKPCIMQSPHQVCEDVGGHAQLVPCRICTAWIPRAELESGLLPEETHHSSEDLRNFFAGEVERRRALAVEQRLEMEAFLRGSMPNKKRQPAVTQKKPAAAVQGSRSGIRKKPAAAVTQKKPAAAVQASHSGRWKKPAHST